jgi:hypothetical protein
LTIPSDLTGRLLSMCPSFRDKLVDDRSYRFRWFMYVAVTGALIEAILSVIALIHGHPDVFLLGAMLCAVFAAVARYCWLVAQS